MALDERRQGHGDFGGQPIGPEVTCTAGAKLGVPRTARQRALRARLVHRSHRVVDQRLGTPRTHAPDRREAPALDLVVRDEKMLDLEHEVRRKIIERLRVGVLVRLGATAISLSLRTTSPSPLSCSASMAPMRRDGTTAPTNAGSSIKRSTSIGSPSSPCVEGTKPKSKGKLAPAVSTPSSTKMPCLSSYLNLLRLPRKASMTALRSPDSGSNAGSMASGWRKPGRGMYQNLASQRTISKLPRSSV